MEKKKDLYDLVSKDDILKYIALIASISFIISIIVTVWFFIKKCNIFNFVVFLIFNIVMAVYFTFPLIAVFDNYTLIMELLEIYDSKELETAKKNIKIAYKIMNYGYYAISDIVIPFCTTLYLNIYLAKKNIDENYKCFSCSILKGFFLFILTIVVFAVGAIVIVFVLPEPKLKEMEEKVEGWDGLMFNWRNFLSLVEYEINLSLGFILLVLNSYYYIRWSLYICFCKDASNADLNYLAYWKVGKLIKKEESKDNDKLSGVDIAKEELQTERNEYLAEKICAHVRKDNNCCNRCFIPKFIYEVPIGFILNILAYFLFYADIHNTFGALTRINYHDIKSQWEKSENREKMRKDIFFDFVFYSFILYCYIFLILYVITTRKYYKEYFPYIGSEHNGYAFLILLKYMLKIQVPIYFIVFFPLMEKDYNSIILDYFQLFKFSVDRIYWPLIKTAAILVFPIFGIFLGCLRGSLIRLLREGDFNEYVIEGKAKIGIIKSNSYHYELSTTEEDTDEIH